MRQNCSLLSLLWLSLLSADAFTGHPFCVRKCSSSLRPCGSSVTDSYDEASNDKIVAKGTGRQSRKLSRRSAIAFGLGTSSSAFLSNAAQASDSYSPSIRPLAYLVDSTIPPTLIPLNARKEVATLKNLGRGSGTSKAAFIEDRINLNNILNKAVFKTIDVVSRISNPNDGESGPGYASFLCLGVPQQTSSEDISLAQSLLSTVMKARRSDADDALGLAFAPMSTQTALDAFYRDGNESTLIQAMKSAAVSESTVQLYLPLLRFARSQSMSFLACAPEAQDVSVVRTEGLQNVNTTRRAFYVADSQGFIGLTRDEKFRIYTDRSLLKDYEPLDKLDQPANFFAERILVHEAAATSAARYAIARPDSLVVILAPIPDLRFLGGINGRIPRICAFLNNETNKVTDKAVTTILLNPTAKETLSLSRYLRLEIGTGPDTIKFQSKLADYLWFSKMPKVNMIPRLMNG